MALPESLKRKKFDDKLLQMKEDLRVIKEKTDFCLNKIRTFEKEKSKLIQEIKKDVSDFDYKKLEVIFKEKYLKVIAAERHYTQVLISIIWDEITNFKETAAEIDSDKIVPGVDKLFSYYSQLQKIGETRIVDLLAEEKAIEHAIANGIPLRDLSILNENEIREKALDGKLKELRHPFIKAIHHVEKGALHLMAEIEAKVEEFENKHTSISNIKFIGEEVVHFFSEVSEKIEGLGIVILAIQAAATLCAGPEALAGLGAVKHIISEIDEIAEIHELEKMVENMEQVNKKLEQISSIPGFDAQYVKLFGKVKDKYSGMRIK